MTMKYSSVLLSTFILLLICSQILNLLMYAVTTESVSHVFLMAKVRVKSCIIRISFSTLCLFINVFFNYKINLMHYQHKSQGGRSTVMISQGPTYWYSISHRRTVNEVIIKTLQSLLFSLAQRLKQTLEPCDTEYPAFVSERTIKETTGNIYCDNCFK